MAVMTLFSAPAVLKSGSNVLVNPSCTTSRADTHPSRSVVSCGPYTSSPYSPHQTSFRGVLWKGMPGSCRSRTGPRTSCVRAVQNSSNATTGTTEERLRVKQELLDRLEHTDGSITPECMDLIGALQKLNPNLEPSQVPELVNGCFQVVRGTVKGRASTNAGVFASIFTLARAAFGVFKPLKQEVIIEEGYNHVGYNQENEYILAFDISMKNREESPEFLHGYLLNKGQCKFVPDSEIMTVTFLTSVLRPADGVKEQELRSWKQLFQQENPSMDERGWMSAELPASEGDLDHLYLDDDLRIVQGTFKNIFVMRRLPGPAVPT